MNVKQTTIPPGGYPQQRTLPPTSYALPLTGFLRLNQIIGTEKAEARKKLRENRETEATFYPPLIPVSKTTWWQGVKDGRYPAAVKLSERCTAWRVEDIRALIDKAA